MVLLRSLASGLVLTACLVVGCSFGATDQSRDQSIQDTTGRRPVGQVLFGTFATFPSQVSVLDLESGDVEVLTDGRVATGATGARWSPDGSMLAWHQHMPDGTIAVMVANAAGAGATMVSADGVNESAPAWSPDCESIVFFRNDDLDFSIWQMDPDGSNRRLLDETGGYNLLGDFSPDGTELVFTSDRGGTGGVELWVRSMAGETVRLAPEVNGLFARWSPNGDRIVFMQQLAEGNRVAVIDVDGADLVGLSDIEVSFTVPIWSPDGRWILYSGREGEMTLIRSDGSGEPMPLGVVGLPSDWGPRNAPCDQVGRALEG